MLVMEAAREGTLDQGSDRATSACGRVSTTAPWQPTPRYRSPHPRSPLPSPRSRCWACRSRSRTTSARSTGSTQTVERRAKGYICVAAVHTVMASQEDTAAARGRARLEPHGPRRPAARVGDEPARPQPPEPRLRARPVRARLRARRRRPGAAILPLRRPRGGARAAARRAPAPLPRPAARRRPPRAVPRAQHRRGRPRSPPSSTPPARTSSGSASASRCRRSGWRAMRERLDAPVLVGVGAAFDFHAGAQAPGARRPAAARARVGVPARPGAAAPVAALPALQPALRARVRAPICATPACPPLDVSGALTVRRTLVAVLACCLAVLAAAPAQRRRRRRRPVDRGPGRRRHAPLRPRHRRRAVDPQLERHELVGLGLARRPAHLRPVGDRAPRRRLRRLRRAASTTRYYHKVFTPAGGWSDWASLRRAASSPAPGATYRQGTRRGRRRRRRRSTTSSTTATGRPGSGWSAWGALGGAHERPAERHLAGAEHPRHLRARHRQPALPEVLDLVDRLERLHPARRRADLRRRGDGVGRQPPRHLRPRRRQRRSTIKSWTSRRQLGRLGAASAAPRAPAPARPRPAPAAWRSSPASASSS